MSTAVVVAVLAVLVGLVVVKAKPATAAFPGTNGKVLVTMQTTNGSTGSGQDIFSVNVDGSGSTELTGDGLSAHGKWSPDGTKIVFNQQGSSGGNNVAVMNADGSGVHVVSSGFGGVFSPDGTQIAYTGSGSQVHVINADGSGDHAVGPTGYNSPAWSSTNKIALVGPVDTSTTQPTVWVINPDGTGLTELANNGLNMDFKPDGSAVLYNAGENGSIRCVPVGGGAPVIYTPNFFFEPIWSPNGLHFLYGSGNGVHNYESNTDGSGQTTLSFSGDVTDWQATGSHPAQPAGGCPAAAGSGGGTTTTTGGGGTTTSSTTVPSTTTTSVPPDTTTTTTPPPPPGSTTQGGNCTEPTPLGQPNTIACVRFILSRPPDANGVQKTYAFNSETDRPALLWSGVATDPGFVGELVATATPDRSQFKLESLEEDPSSAATITADMYVGRNCAPASAAALGLTVAPNGCHDNLKGWGVSVALELPDGSHVNIGFNAANEDTSGHWVLGPVPDSYRVMATPDNGVVHAHTCADPAANSALLTTLTSQLTTPTHFTGDCRALNGGLATVAVVDKGNAGDPHTVTAWLDPMPAEVIAGIATDAPMVVKAALSSSADLVATVSSSSGANTVVTAPDVPAAVDRGLSVSALLDSDNTHYHVHTAQPLMTASVDAFGAETFATLHLRLDGPPTDLDFTLADADVGGKDLAIHTNGTTEKIDFDATDIKSLLPDYRRVLAHVERLGPNLDLHLHSDIGVYSLDSWEDQTFPFLGSTRLPFPIGRVEAALSPDTDATNKTVFESVPPPHGQTVTCKQDTNLGTNQVVNRQLDPTSSTPGDHCVVMLLSNVESAWVQKPGVLRPTLKGFGVDLHLAGRQGSYLAPSGAYAPLVVSLNSVGGSSLSYLGTSQPDPDHATQTQPAANSTQTEEVDVTGLAPTVRFVMDNFEQTTVHAESVGGRTSSVHAALTNMGSLLPDYPFVVIDASGLPPALDATIDSSHLLTGTVTDGQGGEDSIGSISALLTGDPARVGAVPKLDTTNPGKAPEIGSNDGVDIVDDPAATRPDGSVGEVKTVFARITGLHQLRYSDGCPDTIRLGMSHASDGGGTTQKTGGGDEGRLGTGGNQDVTVPHAPDHCVVATLDTLASPAPTFEVRNQSPRQLTDDCGAATDASGDPFAAALAAAAASGHPIESAKVTDASISSLQRHTSVKLKLHTPCEAYPGPEARLAYSADTGGPALVLDSDTDGGHIHTVVDALPAYVSACISTRSSACGDPGTVPNGKPGSYEIDARPRPDRNNPDNAVNDESQWISGDAWVCQEAGCNAPPDGQDASGHEHGVIIRFSRLTYAMADMNIGDLKNLVAKLNTAGMPLNLGLTAFLDNAEINRVDFVVAGVHDGSGATQGDFRAKDFLAVVHDGSGSSSGNIDCGDHHFDNDSWDYAALRLAQASGVSFFEIGAAFLLGGPVAASAVADVAAASDGDQSATHYLCEDSRPFAQWPHPPQHHTISTSSSSASPGGSMTVSGSNYESDTPMRASMHSTPVQLASFHTDSVGNFSQRMTIPLSTPLGTHHIVVSGRGGDLAAIEIKVVPATKVLSRTGRSILDQLAASAVAILLGAALLFSPRRRRRNMPVS